MKFYVDELPVLFPYDRIYPEQLDYMTSMKRGLDGGGHMVLEMPSGTGKTICLLSLLVAYTQFHSEDRRKIIYCTRTVEEMTKTVKELKHLWQHWRQHGAKRDIVGMCLTSRKNLCIEPTVSNLRSAGEVDSACYTKVAHWSKADRCPFYDLQERSAAVLPPGIYTMDDLKEYGSENGLCPYFLARASVAAADVIVHSFLYVVDPRVSEMIKEHTNAGSIVVMDEGHNVDDVCIEAMSMVVTKRDIQAAREKNLPDLNAAVDHMRATNRQRLQDEYDRLVDGLALAQATSGAERRLTLPSSVADQAVPVAIRNSGSFLKFIQTLADFLHKIVLRITKTYIADPLTFLAKVREECRVDIRALHFSSQRLTSLLSTLQISDVHKYRQISNIVALFETLLTHFNDDRHDSPGFVVICEPHDPASPFVHDPIIRLACVDPSLAVREVFSKYKSVILTSGTLSPLHIYPKILGFTPLVSRSFTMTLPRRCVAPMIVSRSSAQSQLLSEDLTSSYEVRTNAGAQEAITKAYGKLLLTLAQTVPDGMVCFFTGYQYMSEVLLSWHSTGLLKELEQHKLVFVETQGQEETTKSLADFRTACDVGRGAIFFSIARGKIAEGIDFDHHYGRAVIMFGVPFLPPTDEALRQRLLWMSKCLNIPEAEYRNFDAMRQASQCIGRVFRNKTDYGLMVMVDRRFALHDKRSKMPGWIQQCIKENSNLTIEAAVGVAKEFFREMAQPWDMAKGLGTTLYDTDALERLGAMSPSAAPTVLPIECSAPILDEGGDEGDDEVVVPMLPPGGKVGSKRPR